jgi:hypothetical protein
VRRVAWEDRLAPGAPGAWRFEASANVAGRVDTSLDVHSFDRWRAQLDAMLRVATPPTMRTLSAPMTGPRELAILRFTSGADLASQTYEGASMFGYSVLHVTKQTDVPRVNRASYFINRDSSFTKVDTVDVNRTVSMTSRASTNPLTKMFEW